MIYTAYRNGQSLGLIFVLHSSLAPDDILTDGRFRGAIDELRQVPNSLYSQSPDEVAMIDVMIDYGIIVEASRDGELSMRKSTYLVFGTVDTCGNVCIYDAAYKGGER